MELNSELWIFEDVAGQYKNDGFARYDESAPAQFFESSQRHGGSWLATDAVGADLRFSGGDFDLGDLFDLAASRSQHPQRFLPRCRIADSYSGRERTGSHRLELLPSELSYAAIKRIRA